MPSQALKELEALMANHKSALKRARQNRIRRTRNRGDRTRRRSQVKRFRSAVQNGELETASGLLAPTLSIIDRSIKKGVLPDNTGSRHKSRLTRLLNHALAVQQG